MTARDLSWFVPTPGHVSTKKHGHRELFIMFFQSFLGFTIRSNVFSAYVCWLGCYPRVKFHSRRENAHRQTVKTLEWSQIGPGHIDQLKVWPCLAITILGLVFGNRYLWDHCCSIVAKKASQHCWGCFGSLLGKSSTRTTSQQLLWTETWMVYHWLEKNWSIHIIGSRTWRHRDKSVVVRPLDIHHPDGNLSAIVRNAPA